MRINEVNNAIRASFIEWDGFLINPRNIRKNNEVTWDSRTTPNRNAIFRKSDVRGLAENGQYTLQVAVDGSLMQLYYRFDRNNKQLESANLAYYCAISVSERVGVQAQLAESDVLPTDDAELGSTDDPIQDTFLDQIVSWLRIDYDPNATERGVIHSDCHMHISGFALTRFIVYGVPSPKQFIEFVIASVYPETYKEHRLELHAASNDGSLIWQYREPQQIDRLNRECIPMEDKPIYKQLSHFHVPSD